MEIDDFSPLTGLPITELTLYRTNIKSLEPLRGMPLRIVNLSTSPKISDLSPLRGMLLQELNISHTAVEDLSPLQGMPLTSLECVFSKVKDLRPLQGMELTNLGIRCLVRDLTPLRDMKLETINLPAPVKTLKGLEILRAMESLQRINNLEPAEFWKKLDAGEIK